jgi:hypothetical protein
LFLGGWLLNIRIVVALGNKINRAPLLGFYRLALQTLTHFVGSSVLDQKKHEEKKTEDTDDKMKTGKSLTDRFFSEIESAGRSIAVLSNQQVAGPDQRSQEERSREIGNNAVFGFFLAIQLVGPRSVDVNVMASLCGIQL